MTDAPTPVPGAICWIDLTVPNCEEVRDFYEAVAGWQVSAAPMGEYDDYCMAPPGGEAVAGVCHQRGTNAGMPSSWMIYITVADLDASMTACKERGGQVVVGPKAMGKARFCVVRDPAGAVAGLYEG